MSYFTYSILALCFVCQSCLSDASSASSTPSNTSPETALEVKRFSIYTSELPEQQSYYLSYTSDTIGVMKLTVDKMYTGSSINVILHTSDLEPLDTLEFTRPDSLLFDTSIESKDYLIEIRNEDAHGFINFRFNLDFQFIPLNEYASNIIGRWQLIKTCSIKNAYSCTDPTLMEVYNFEPNGDRWTILSGYSAGTYGPVTYSIEKDSLFLKNESVTPVWSRVDEITMTRDTLHIIPGDSPTLKHSYKRIFE